MNKKKIFMTLFIIVCLCFSINEVYADWFGYGNGRTSNPYNVHYNAKEDVKKDGDIKPLGPTIVCDYPSQQLGEDIGNPRTFFVTKITGKTPNMFWFGSIEGGVGVGDDHDFYADSLTVDQATSLCKDASDCVCPIGYMTAKGNRIWWGIGSDQMRKDNDYIEFIPLEGTSSKICLGTREHFTSLNGFISSMKDYPAKFSNVSTLADSLVKSVSGEINYEKANEVIEQYNTLNTTYSELLTEYEKVDADYQGEDQKKVCDSRCGNVTTTYCSSLTQAGQYKDSIDVNIETINASLKSFVEKLPEINEKATEGEISEASVSKLMAESMKAKAKTGALGVRDFTIDLNQGITCGILDPALVSTLRTVLNLVRIVAPIFLIILTAIDFSQAVISNDQDSMKKAVSKVGKRVIATLALFFIPLIVSALLDMPGIKQYTSETQKCDDSIFISE